MDFVLLLLSVIHFGQDTRGEWGLDNKTTNYWRAKSERRLANSIGVQNQIVRGAIRVSFLDNANAQTMKCKLTKHVGAAH